MFGNWEMLYTFGSEKPYPHTVISNFFSHEAFQKISEEFGNPEADKGWIKYWNPIEKKFALNEFSNKPFVSQVFDEIQSNEFIDKLKSICGFSHLQKDEYMHGSGLHYHPRNGKLDMHLDYSIHPKSGLERKLNLIIYINETWKEEWGGALELWDKDFTHCVKQIYPYRNTAILFQTSDISYHGIPYPITCPESIGRRSLAVYYMTVPNDTTLKRYKAEFRPLPDQVVSQPLQQLYTIRKTRNITDIDLQELGLYE